MAEEKKLNMRERLRKLFTSSVIYRPKGKGKTVVIDPNSYMSVGSASGTKASDKYGRIYRNSKGFDIYGANTVYGGSDFSSLIQTRMNLYTDYESMDTNAIISSALDIYADECTTNNEKGEIISIHTSDNEIKELLHNLFYDILDVEYNLWPWVRNMCKYGDTYLGLNVQEGLGIIGVVPLSSYYMVRMEGSEDNPYDVKFKMINPDQSIGFGSRTVYNKLKEKDVDEFESFEIAHFRLLSDTNFLPYGKCLTGNSYVDTEFGKKRIDEIKVGEKIWSFNKDLETLELTTIQNTCESGIKEVIKISTQHNSVECSEEHPILVHSNGSLLYKQAKQIQIGDLLVLSNNSHKSHKEIKLNKDFSHIFNKNEWKNKCEHLPEVLDKEFARFFGFMIGDGRLSKKGGMVTFAMGMYDDLNFYYANLLSKYSGKEYIMKRSENGVSGYAFVNSVILTRFLQMNEFKSKAKSKRLPTWIFDASEEIKIEFIRGLADADAYVSVDKFNVVCYNLEMTNKVLIEDIKALLDSINIKCSDVSEKGYHGRTTICGIECNRSKSYQIYFYLDGDKKKQHKKYKKSQTENYFTLPVRKIESTGKQQTYDIQVQSNNSNFIANGIVVHNSALEGVRKDFKVLLLLEDAMLLHRIMRAPEKRVFKVDIGNLPEEEVDAFMEKIMTGMKKIPHIDEETNQYNLRYNLQNMLEDFYIPVRGDNSGMSIESLPGLEYAPVEDLEFVRSKIFAGLKIPKPFLGYDENMGEKSGLAMMDVRFARTIDRYQKMALNELNKMAIVHLFAQGIEDERLVDFSLSLTNPSIIYEQEKIELFNNKVSLATAMKETKMISREYIYKHVFNLSEEEYKYEAKVALDDIKTVFRESQIESEGNDPALTKESVGTAWDIASLHVRNKLQDDDLGIKDKGGAPEGGQPGAGRPKSNKKYGTHKSNFGRDPLSKRELIGKTFDYDDKINYKYKGGSNFAFENILKRKNNNILNENNSLSNFLDDLKD